MRPTVPREAAIVDTIRRHLRRLPACYHYKTGGDCEHAGWPDILGCLAGRAFAFEVKRPGPDGLELTPLQKVELGRWAAAGAVAAVVHSWAEVCAVLHAAGVPGECLEEKK